jgi:hypothetical protein
VRKTVVGVMTNGEVKCLQKQVQWIGRYANSRSPNYRAGAPKTFTTGRDVDAEFKRQATSMRWKDCYLVYRELLDPKRDVVIEGEGLYIHPMPDRRELWFLRSNVRNTGNMPGFGSIGKTRVTRRWQDKARINERTLGVLAIQFKGWQYESCPSVSRKKTSWSGRGGYCPEVPMGGRVWWSQDGGQVTKVTAFARAADVRINAKGRQVPRAEAERERTVLKAGNPSKATDAAGAKSDRW